MLLQAWSSEYIMEICLLWTPLIRELFSMRNKTGSGIVTKWAEKILHSGFHSPRLDRIFAKFFLRFRDACPQKSLLSLNLMKWWSSMTETSFDSLIFSNNDCILLRDGNPLGVLTPIQLVYNCGFRICFQVSPHRGPARRTRTSTVASKFLLRWGPTWALLLAAASAPTFPTTLHSLTLKP
jgi:hypothetical protein